MLAIIFEAKEVIGYLLDNKASCLIRNSVDKSALYYAVACKNPEILQLFLAQLKI